MLDNAFVPFSVVRSQYILSQPAVRTLPVVKQERNSGNYCCTHSTLLLSSEHRCKTEKGPS